MLTAPYVHLNNSRKAHPENGGHDSAMIDYTNLYIKNLDPEVTSYDLFKRFKPYGKIISARVMKDTVTSISKGYGFVSYTHMDEANEALQNMNGALINTKNIIVTFHTHKKTAHKANNKHRTPPPVEYMNLSPPTSASTTNSNLYQMYPSQPSPPYNNVTAPPPYGFIPEHIPSKSTSHNPWNETGIWMHKSPVVPHHAYHTSSVHAPTTSNASILVSPSSPPLIDLNTNISYQKPNEAQDTNIIQLQKIRAAISAQLKDHQQKDLNDLVDMIQSLKKRDLSLCLFNPTFLKQKIDEAYEALYLFQNTTPASQQPTEEAPRCSMNDINSATAILNSLEGLTLNKKKRVFGDIFFPFVRATGVKHAPKVTIRLLDTVPLEELAFSMYDKSELTRKAQYTYSQLYPNKNEY